MQRTNIRYRDFDLVFDRHQSGYMVRVTGSPAGEADHRFARLSELQEERVRTFRAIVSGHRQGKRRIDSPEMHEAKRLGGDLFELVFGGPIEECYRESMKKVWSEPGTGLRVRLHMRTAPELADLPWEYLYDARENQFLSLSVSTPLVRYLEISRPVQPLTVEPPLRVLVMISNPSDIDDLDVEEEWRQLQEAVADLGERGLVTFDRLENATLDELQRQLRREEYHVFHYIGHAGFDDQADDGVLILENERGRSRQVNAERLGNILHDEESLRLAILNACEGARSSRKDAFSGLAQSLVQKGVPAVIAMQFEISDEAAITMSHEFYRALGEGYPADAALGEARKMVSNGNELEWGTPVLFLRSPDAVLFDVSAVSEASRTRAQLHRLVGAAREAASSGRWPEALARAEAALVLDPANVAAGGILEEARAQVSSSAADADRLAREAATLAEQERLRTAEAERLREAEARRTEATRAEEERLRRDDERRERERREDREREERILAGIAAAAGVKPKRTKLRNAVLGVLGAFVMGSIYVASQQAPGFTEGSLIEPTFVMPSASPANGAVDDKVDTSTPVIPPPPPAQPPAPPPSARYESEIVDAIARASYAEAEAMRMLTPALLEQHYADNALVLLTNYMSMLVGNNVHQQATLENRVVHSIDVSDDGAFATVGMTETWSTEFHQNGTDLCVGRVPSYDHRQTLQMRRTGGGWRIVSVDSQDVSPDPQPCFAPVP